MRALLVPAAGLAVGSAWLFGIGGVAGESSSAHSRDEGFVIEVPGIPGPYCAYGIEKRLRELPGVSAVVTDWREETIRVRGAWADLSAADVEAAVEDSEYPYEYTVR